MAASTRSLRATQYTSFPHTAAGRPAAVSGYPPEARATASIDGFWPTSISATSHAGSIEPVWMRAARTSDFSPATRGSGNGDLGPDSGAPPAGAPAGDLPAAACASPAPFGLAAATNAASTTTTAFAYAGTRSSSSFTSARAEGAIASDRASDSNKEPDTAGND